MNTKDKNINNAAGSRRTYLSPCTETITMATSNLIMESRPIPIDTPGATDANGKQWQDDSDSWDEVDANPYKKARSVW